MSDRRIDAVRHYNGVITHIRTVSGVVETKDMVVRHIDFGAHTYYVQWMDKRTEVRAVGYNPRYIRTDWDDTPRNNLDDLDEF